MSITVIGEEPHPAYDRVALSSLFDGRTATDLHLTETGPVDRTRGRDPRRRPGRRRSTGRTGPSRTTDDATVAYDQLVLATGSSPFVPPIDGPTRTGCFVYRTIDDLEAIAADGRPADVVRGVVVGGGLLGLEAANALRLLGLETHVVEFAARLMPRPARRAAVGRPCAATSRGSASRSTPRCARQRIEADGDAGRIASHAVRRPRTRSPSTWWCSPPASAPATSWPASRRPRGRRARRRRRRRPPPHRRPERSAPSASAPAVDGRCYGLVAPGYQMARVVAAHVGGLAAGHRRAARLFDGADMSTKLKLLGVDVGQLRRRVARPPTDDADHLVWDDPVARRVPAPRRRPATGRVLAGVLVGDASAYPTVLAPIPRGPTPRSSDPGLLIAPRRRSPPASHDVGRRWSARARTCTAVRPSPARSPTGCDDVAD